MKVSDVPSQHDLDVTARALQMDQEERTQLFNFYAVEDRSAARRAEVWRVTKFLFWIAVMAGAWAIAIFWMKP